MPYKSIPAGWYCVAFSHEVKPGQVVRRRYFERDLVVYRTASGVARVVDAHCPHLGAHLGEGGRVEGERLRCPFHGFCFDVEGACVSTPYGTRPPRLARLGMWRVREVHGIILTWYHPRGEAPFFEIPDIDTTGWSAMKTRAFDLRSHPQETSENSVDFGHFTIVHSFLDGRITKPAAIDGALLTASYRVKRALDMIGMPKRGVEVTFDVYVRGLGYSMVHGTLPGFGVRMRHFVCSTPVDCEHVRLHIGSRGGRVPIPGLTRLIRAIVFWGLKTEVSQDLKIWENKRYLTRPALARGDGAIGTYRKYCRQFYEDGDDGRRRLRTVSSLDETAS